MKNGAVQNSGAWAPGLHTNAIVDMPQKKNEGVGVVQLIVNNAKRIALALSLIPGDASGSPGVR